MRSNLKTNLYVLFVDLAIVLLFAAKAHAAEPVRPGSAEPRSIPLPVAEAAADAESNDDEGGFGGLSVSVGGVADSKVANRKASYALTGVEVDACLFLFNGSYKRLQFDWNRIDDFVIDTGGRKPWGDLNEFSFGANWGGEIGEKIVYMVMGGISAGFEKQTDGAYSYYLGSLGLYRLSERWLVSGGVLWSRHQEIRTDFDVIPVLGVTWNPEATNGLSVSLGIPTTEVAWHFNDKTRLILDMSDMEGGVYRLADDNPLREKGYVEFMNSSLSLRFQTRLAKRLELELAAGMPLSREFTLYDHDGKNKETHKVEKQPGFKVALSTAF